MSMVDLSPQLQVNQLQNNAEMHHLSLECTSTSAAPVFNISNCSSVNIHYSK